MTLTSKDRQDIYAEQYGRILESLKPSMPGRYSGQQVAYAKGRARKAALAIIDEIERRP